MNDNCLHPEENHVVETLGDVETGLFEQVRCGVCGEYIDTKAEKGKKIA